MRCQCCVLVQGVSDASALFKLNRRGDSARVFPSSSWSSSQRQRGCPRRRRDAACDGGRAAQRPQWPAGGASGQANCPRDKRLTLIEAYAVEDAAKREVLATADAREGPRAFVEKREPRYEGR
jgi:hypothetical protein